jgi:predicted small metal-binding protein
VGELVCCDCGFEARAADEDGLVAAIQRHAWEAHGMPLSHDEALLLAVRAELDETALPTGLASRQTDQHARGEK